MKKGMTMIMAIMISTVMLISISGVIFLINHQRQSVFGNISETKLAFLAESGMNLGLTWLKEQKRSDALNVLTEFPAGGGWKTYTIDGTLVMVKGVKNTTTKLWTFTSKAIIDSKTCEVEASNLTPAVPLNDGSGIEFGGLGGANGSRVKINGVHNYKLNDTKQMSIMCWVKTAPNGTIGSGQTAYKWSNIVSNVKPSNPGNDCQFMLQHDSQNEYIEFALKNANGGRKYIMSNKKMQSDTWYHVVATYDNQTMKVYVNEDYARWNMRYSPAKKLSDNKWYLAYNVISRGYNTEEQANNNQRRVDNDVARYEREFPGFINKGILNPTSSYVTNIGSTSASSGGEGWRNYKGRIDDVSIWNKALTEAEIARYRIGASTISGKEDNLQAYWDFEDIPVGTIGPGATIANKKMIKNNQGEWVYDTSLNGVGYGSLITRTNSDQNRDDNTANKLVGELKRKWTIKYY